MSELKDFIEISKRVIQLENDNTTKPKFSPVFEFPFNNDYYKWLNIKSEKFPFGRKPRKFWNEFYGEIIEQHIKPAGLTIPSEWESKLISYRTLSVYMIADLNETVLYIGKCEYTPIIRLLDRMIPKSLNQMNNVPEIWENYLSKAIKVKCVYTYDLGFDPEILESYLLNEYLIHYDTLPRYNKRMPTQEFYNKVLNIRAKMSQ
jgi:hypothetical protein